MPELKHRLLALFVFLLPAVGMAGSDVRIAYSEPVRLIAAQDYGTGLSASEPGTSRLKFDALDRRFDISMTSNMGIFSSELRQRVSDDVVAYRGALDGVPGSWARIVTANGVHQGVIWDGREMFALEPAPQGGSIIFRLSDLIIEPGSMSCGSAGRVTTGEQLLAKITEELEPRTAEAQGASQELEVSVVGDFELNEAFVLGGAEDAIISRMNVVDGIFSSQVGVQVTITELVVFDDAADPFSDVTVAGDLLDEVNTYRRNDSARRLTGLTHLFTGRDLDGTTAGIAYVGVLCSQSFGTGLTQATRGVTTDSLVAAHEFGHNFGAVHDGEEGRGCDSTPETFLMAPSVNGNSQLSQCSLDSIAIEVAGASCLASLSTSDIAVAAPAGASRALMGESGSAEFEVSNEGTTVANNATLSVQLADGGTYEGISVTAGSCNDVAGGAQCNLGSVAAGAVVGVTVSGTRDTPGSITFDAVVSADSDAFDTNDEASNRIDFDPVADVQVSAPNGSVEANRSVFIDAGVENISNERSNLLVVSVQVDSGLGLDAAEWSRGDCSITDNTAECEPTGLNGGASDTLRLTLSGTSEGDFGYTVSAVSPTFDPDETNNASTGQVNVTAASAPPPPPPVAPPADSGGGGGGSADWWLVLLLGSLLVGANAPMVRRSVKI